MVSRLLILCLATVKNVECDGDSEKTSKDNGYDSTGAETIFAFITRIVSFAIGTDIVMTYLDTFDSLCTGLKLQRCIISLVIVQCRGVVGHKDGAKYIMTAFKSLYNLCSAANHVISLNIKCIRSTRKLHLCCAIDTDFQEWEFFCIDQRAWHSNSTAA